MDLSYFNSLLILLLAVVLTVIVCNRIKFPPIIGYIIIGLFLGPNVLAVVPETTVIRTISEFGIVFLMFTIGLEFSMSKMLKLKRLVFGLGSLQVILTSSITTVVGRGFGLSWKEAIVIGCIVAMSSTAIVSKQLTDQNELTDDHGIKAISILLFQDLAVIPFFILISSFGPAQFSIASVLMLALVKAIIAISIIIVVGRWILRPVFETVAYLESLELFTLIVLLVTLGSAWLTNELGLSLALGAFLAGMMLGETEFRHQIAASIRPFRDILLGLFFVSVGMLFNLKAVIMYWPWVLLLLSALILLKMILISVLSYLANRKVENALRTGLVLAQGGEFGFALLALTMSKNLLPLSYGQVILAGLLVSMALTPIVIKYNEKIAYLLTPQRLRQNTSEDDIEFEHLTKHLKDHVVLCGFSRIGQQLAKILDDEGIKYIAIDKDHQLVRNSQAAGCSVIYGDGSMYEMLVTCKIQKAKALVLACEDISISEKILPQVRSHLKKIPIFVRTHDDNELDRLQELGATEVIPASLELSITLATHLLICLGVRTDKISRKMNAIRKNRYRLLRDIIPEEEE